MCRKPPWSFAGNSDLPDAANATQACPGLRRESKERNVALGLVPRLMRDSGLLHIFGPASELRPTSP